MNEECYLDGTNKIIPFVPETNPVDIKMNSKIYQKYFPKSNINYNSLRISNIGIYSIAKPEISKSICKLIKKICKTTDITITDALANVGGMTMMFAKYFKSVIACEIIPIHCEILQSNLKVYSLNEKVTVHCNDYLSVMKSLTQDVIFFDPPWGGRDYKKEDTIDLGINNLNIACIINVLIKNVKYIFLRVPYNFNYNRFMKLISSYTKIRFYKLNPELKEKSQVLISIKKM